jgi:hypothetical protein
MRIPAARSRRKPAQRRAAALVPHLVGAYVIYHALSVFIGSLPAPADALNRASWKDPTVQSELDAWAARAQRYGWNISRADFEDTCYRALQQAMRWYRVALTPFRAYQEHTGTAQAWAMFAAPDLHPSLLHVDIQLPAGDWQPIYVARSDQATWRRAQLDHIRFRSAIFRFPWPQFRRGYRDFASWLADQAALDFPDARAVRVRFFTYTTPTPEQARARVEPVGAFEHTLTFPRDAHR